MYHKKGHFKQYLTEYTNFSTFQLSKTIFKKYRENYWEIILMKSAFLKTLFDFCPQILFS